MSDASDADTSSNDDTVTDTTAPAVKIGTAGWMDLTVENADEVRDFYKSVLGWRAEPLDMGGYSDYMMFAPNGDGVAGVCHARGSNVGLPPVWMIYFYVADLDASIASCNAGGGAVVYGPRNHGKDRFAVVRDPGGASCGIYQKG